jgi:ABC-type branched-subunit amino acid transport system permease subunit
MILVGMWQLPPLGFIAPIGLAALAASLSYCRAWLTERGGLRPWVAPAALIAAAVSGVVLSVPMVREAQVARGLHAVVRGAGGRARRD